MEKNQGRERLNALLKRQYVDYRRRMRCIRIMLRWR